MDETSDVVNIGLHFVATAGLNSTQPKDTDGDGVPDYVEDTDGDNAIDTLETNPNASDSGSDLDGDHLTSLQEYIFGTNPSVADTDGDGINDGDEDFDGDSIANWIELQNGSDPLNRAPVAYPQLVAVAKNVPHNVTLTASDYEGNPLTFAVVVQPAHGILSGTAPHIIYSPAQDYTGYDSFAFKVNDGHGDSMSATVFISVQESTSTPAVVIISPTLGTTVRGQLFVNALAVDDVRTVSAVLYIDGMIHARLLGDQLSQFAVDTTKLNNGAHALGGSNLRHRR